MRPAGAHEHDSETEPREEAARETLVYGRRVRRRRRFWRSLPGAPRCKLCTAPLGGPVGTLLRLIGKGRWPGNPKYCRWCFKSLYTHRSGAEVECTLLFADIRGSTQLAEMMQARDFRTAMERFYETAVSVLTERDAFVDKFVGDEVIGIFIPALTGNAHARQAVDAGLELLIATGHQTDAPWAPIGIGVNTGVAYVGAVGTEEHVEFTALGDTVNVAARLASVAAPGELLVAAATAQAAGLEGAGAEGRHLALKGKTEATDVFVLTA
jgi:adenylate cyclase